jgi:hypothetical protein
MLSMIVRELIKFLVGKFIVLNNLKGTIRDSKSSLEIVSRKFILNSPHKIMLVDTVINLFITNSS